MVLRRATAAWPLRKYWSSPAWTNQSDYFGLRGLGTKVDYFDESCDRRIAPIFRVIADKGPLSAKACWDEIVRRKADAPADDPVQTNLHMVSKKKMKQALNWLKYKKWIDTRPSGFNKRNIPTGNFLYVVHQDRLEVEAPQGDSDGNEQTNTRAVE